ncbi:transcription-repair coupling factor [Candidatus Saganbacteria bacterium]|nr:transcription-repair coupling factor [Candidatus Saganbacteria bacterium]
MIASLLNSLLQDQNFIRSVSSKKFQGLVSGAKAAVLSALSIKHKKIFIVTQSTEESNWLKQEIALFNDKVGIDILPAPDAMPGESSVSPEIIGQRLSILNKLSKPDQNITIAPLRAILYKTTEKIDRKLSLRKNSRLNSEKFIAELILFGYKRLPVVGERGEFSVKGGIIDVFPTNAESPIRIELFGDDIESLRSFDPVSQRSKAPIDEALILQNDEKREKCLFQILPKDILVVLDEEPMLKAATERFEKDSDLFSEAKHDICSFSEIRSQIDSYEKINFTSFLEPGFEPVFSAPGTFADKLDDILKLKKKVIVVTQHAARLPETPSIIGQLRGGFEFNDHIVLTDRELFNIEPRKPKIHSKKNEGVGEDIRSEFKNGDYIVHEDYGVGIYRGLQKIEEGEFALIEFAEGDKLYVPSNLMGRVEKYVSEDNYKPKLSRMGGNSWKVLKAKVKRSVKDLTRELLSLYAERRKAQKNPYPRDDIWQKELEDSFPYEETDDQLRSIADVKRDLESEAPMDRLLCGDVGYGKTEVALRAIVKVASSGKQVAVLVPTTILAEQHFHFFKDRLASFPFRIASLSRFRSKQEQKEIVEKLKAGEVDIVVGTHRLLSKDIVFKDLGLLVIDEEHRFGVSAKEKLKKIKKNIDVLSMTATPIPRTLYFSLSGARDLSLIQTPPADRSPVRTYVVNFNHSLVREAILRELDRGGQIFFVHNYIETIDNLALILKQLIPELRVAVAHGQMLEAKLEKTMEEFLNREHDVLLCTSIIESGLDIPNVNTIIIDRADRLGLAQLYQLRGRVGRSPVRAYAYFLYHQEEASTQTALARLKAIQEFTSLGSGYKLALRDLEIRGSGNLLGAQQHGHMLAVGFDLYCELLEEAVKEVKGIKEPTPRQVIIDIREDAYIPQDYVEDEQQRVALYRRLNLLSGNKEVDDLKDEMRDRFGKIPIQLTKLFKILYLKVRAQQAGIRSIKGDGIAQVQFSDGRVKKFRLSSQDKIKEIGEALNI